jgi:hypothetical protein
MIGLPYLPLGEPLHRLTGDLDAASGFLTNNPGIVPRGDDIGVTRTYSISEPSSATTLIRPESSTP